MTSFGDALLDKIAGSLGLSYEEITKDYPKVDPEVTARWDAQIRHWDTMKRFRQVTHDAYVIRFMFDLMVELEPKSPGLREYVEAIREH